MKKPRPDGGVSDRGLRQCLARASISGPRMGTFFRRQSCARTRDHLRMMRVANRYVNSAQQHGLSTQDGSSVEDVQTKKSRAQKSPA